jgi:putative copper resistance protein D
MHVIPEWLELISLSFCIGVIVCRLWFFTHSTQGEFSYQENFVSRMWTLFCFGLAFMIAGSMAELLSRTAEMSGQPFPAFFSALPTVLFRTHYGVVWITRIGALLLLALSKTAVRYRDKRAFLFPMLLLGMIVAMTASASGHASDAGDLSLPEIMDWLHLLAAAIWGGGLMVLSVFVLPDLTGRKEPTPALIAKVVSRFSAMAGFAVGVVALTALYNAWKYVGSVNALLGGPYGWTIIAKIFLFLVLINLGGFNRYVSVPLLQEWAGASAKGRGIFTRIALQFFPGLQMGGNGGRVASRFMRGVKVEAILIIGVLLCAALLRHEIPARHASHLGYPGGKGHSMPYHNHGGNM